MFLKPLCLTGVGAIEKCFREWTQALDLMMGAHQASWLGYGMMLLGYLCCFLCRCANLFCLLALQAFTTSLCLPLFGLTHPLWEGLPGMSAISVQCFPHCLCSLVFSRCLLREEQTACWAVGVAVDRATCENRTNKEL